MAESPHRSDVPDEAGGAAVPASAPPVGAAAPPVASAVPTTAVDVEMPALDHSMTGGSVTGGSVTGGSAPVTADPTGAPPAEPWWMQAPPDLSSGPQRVPDLAGTAGDVSTGPHRLPMAGGGPASVTSGAHPVVSTGPQPRLGWTASGHLGAGSPPAERNTARRNIVIMAVAVAVGLVAALAVGTLLLDSGGGSGQRAEKQPPRHRVTAAPAAGGLQRTPGIPAATAAYPFLAGAVRAGGAERPGNVTGVYADLPARTQNVVFIGGTGRIGDPVAFLRKARPSTVLTAQDVRPGRSGGHGVCGTFAVLTDVHMYCSWATEDSFGFVASNRPAPGPDTTALADLMRRMRADLEK